MASPSLSARRTPDDWLKPGVLLGALVPLAVTGLRAAQGALGANPVSTALNQFGLLAVIFLLASLAATPLKRAFGWVWPMRIRRLLGLLSFFYASLHVVTYVALDRLGALGTLLEDVTERPFITVGFATFLLLVPLAATSTRAAQKRMGFAAWQRLHRLSYVAAALAIVHFVWREKKDIREPLLYGAVLALLLFSRLIAARRRR